MRDDADAQQMAEAEDKPWYEDAWDWVVDNGDELAAGALAVGAAALIVTGVGAPIGAGILLGMGVSGGLQLATTGELAALVGVESCIAAELESSAAHEDWTAFELLALAASLHPDRSMTTTLCEVLDQQRDDISNDDVVTALDAIADPASVDSLERALWWEPPWDEFRQLAIKCAWALSAIGTREALDVLRDAASTAPERVREAAAEALASSDRGTPS